MKKILSMMDNLAAMMINFLRFGKNKNSNVLTQNIHLHKGYEKTAKRSINHGGEGPSSGFMEKNGELLRRPYRHGYPKFYRNKRKKTF